MIIKDKDKIPGVKPQQPIVEGKKMNLREHNQLHMCFNCKDAECKDKGYFKMHRCKNFFYWVLCMASLLIALIGMVAAYVIVRISDGNWTDWKLPLALAVGFVAFALIAFTTVTALDFKHRTGDAIYE